MAIQVFLRKEIKYIITEQMYQLIRRVVEDYMEIDAHTKRGDFYPICNIYYDTLDHQLIRKSIEKPIYKEKLRLRSYGTAQGEDIVYLEIKKKFQGIVNKRRLSLSLSEAYEYMNGGDLPSPCQYINQQVLKEIEYLKSRYHLGPSLYLSYKRSAYVDKEHPDFRITFDTNIQTRRERIGLEYTMGGVELLPKGLWVMEAKAEKSFPLWFTKLLAENRIYPISFSKYGSEYRRAILGLENVPNIIQKNCYKEEGYFV